MARPQNTGRFTDDDIEQIYIELRDGTPHRKIGEMFGVSTSMIQHINQGRQYGRTGWHYPIVDRPKKKVRHDDLYYDKLVLESMDIRSE